MTKKDVKLVTGAIVIIMIAIIISLVYAVFTGQLNITGSAVNRQSKWDIHFENVSNITTTGTAKVLNNHEPVINSNNRTEIQDYEVSLTSPKDSISFTFDVVNDGNYNAKITTIDIETPECSSTDTISATNMCNNLTYTLTYDSGATVQTNDIIYVKDKISLKVTLTFNEISDPTLLPKAGVSISNLGIEIDFEQEGNALVKDNGEVANYKVYHQGDKITLNNEDYWVIENSGAGQDYVVALKDIILIKMVYGATSDYNTSNIKSFVDNWSNTTFVDNELKEINDYKARLITETEYNAISIINNWRFKSDEWYWSMSPQNGSTTLVYKINYDGSSANNGGVRPVINVYKSALETNNNE